MKIKHYSITPIVLYGLSVIALMIYFHGFFPIEHSFEIDKLEPVKRNNDVKYNKKDALFDKLVLLVIDALRFDFVFPATTKKFMPFTTSSIIAKKSCLVKLKAQSPTVTMPRLKAMTSGMVPTYFDVISNFMTRESKVDSFIHQAVLNNLKIVFYGDDTWIKLFPKAFIRSEGTSSFFASDYTEVDYNVTRHLNEEFKKSDWDFLILHYLGLDHIGHMEGPKSSLIEPKLKEMDNVIFEIFQYLQKREEEGMKTLFFVTSDHGMKDSGGHGGVTEPEVLLPLVSIGKSCNHIPGWPDEYVPEQIDLAPTIATAFGLPMPDNNVGKIIPLLLHEINVEHVLEMLELNRMQLRLRSGLTENDVTNNEDTPERAELLGDISKTKLSKEIRRYFHDLSQLSEGLRSVTSFNMVYLLLSISLMWVILIIMTLKLVPQYFRPRRITQYFLLLGTFLYGVSFSSTSLIEEEHQTWYFLWVTLCILIVMDTLNRKEFSFSQNMKSAIPWIATLFAHRVLRKLNQTGDKWAMLPDIKGFLNSPESHSLLALIYVLGLSALILCVFNEGCSKSQLVTFTCALLVNLCYRFSVSNLHIHLLNFYPKSRGSIECTLFWILTVLFAVQTQKLSLVWNLAATILVKPHNIILLPMALFVNKQINNLYKNPMDALWNCIAHFWVGFVFYFYQGNSNSIANIDVSAGFTGLEKYNPVYSFIMIAVHTNIGHILAYSSSPQSHLIFSVLWLYPITLYCTFLLFQLNHVFIWSVFSPKLLYEINFSLIYLLLVFCDYFCCFILNLSLLKQKFIKISW